MLCQQGTWKALASAGCSFLRAETQARARLLSVLPCLLPFPAFVRAACARTQDPCTFRIVLKNTVDLEPADVQEAALQKMDALVLSYQHLDSLLEMAREGNAGARARAHA